MTARYGASGRVQAGWTDGGDRHSHGHSLRQLINGDVRSGELTEIHNSVIRAAALEFHLIADQKAGNHAHALCDSHIPRVSARDHMHLLDLLKSPEYHIGIDCAV